MNSAVIKESSGNAVEEMQVPGICRVLLKHDVKTTSAEFEWTGPKIGLVEWAKMMAFFEWTYETEKSEAQVRWYVHPINGWRCWAFPQKGGTSMTTKEIADHPMAIEQRKQFAGHEGWSYFMTVHHHCSAGAFQSSTDKADEKGVDGIHITIGKMDKPERDMDVRMYLKSHKFEPRMQFFWDVGQEMADKAAECFKVFGFMPDMHKLALSQMARSHELLVGKVEGEKFPKAWEDNYIVDKPVITTGGVYFPGQMGGSIHDTQRGQWCYRCQKMTDHSYSNCPKTYEPEPKKNGKPGKSRGGEKSDDFSCRTTLNDIVQQLAALGYSDRGIQELLADCLGGDYCDAMEIIYRELIDAKIETNDMALFFNDFMLRRDQQAAQSELQQQQTIPPTTEGGLPAAWDGYGAD